MTRHGSFRFQVAVQSRLTLSAHDLGTSLRPQQKPTQKVARSVSIPHATTGRLTDASVTMEKRIEKQFTPNIIWYWSILYVLKIRSCSQVQSHRRAVGIRATRSVHATARRDMNTGQALSHCRREPAQLEQRRECDTRVAPGQETSEVRDNPSVPKSLSSQKYHIIDARSKILSGQRLEVQCRHASSPHKSSRAIPDGQRRETRGLSYATRHHP